MLCVFGVRIRVLFKKVCRPPFARTLAAGVNSLTRSIISKRFEEESGRIGKNSRERSGNGENRGLSISPSLSLYLFFFPAFLHSGGADWKLLGLNLVYIRLWQGRVKVGCGQS